MSDFMGDEARDQGLLVGRGGFVEDETLLVEREQTPVLHGVRQERGKRNHVCARTQFIKTVITYVLGDLLSLA